MTRVRAILPISLGLVALSTLHAQQVRIPLPDPTHETTTPDVPNLTTAASRCGISDDSTYGTTEANAVKVGGGAAYLASREQKYLGALRGPAGQGLHFKRRGSHPEPDGTILDLYDVDYPGVGHPVQIYIDGYHWVTPRAPKGWLCGADMNLNPPGPDPFKTHDQLMSLAVRLGETEVEPISLDPDGSKVHGVIFDHVRLIALAARAASKAGTPLDPKNLPRDVTAPKLLAIAFPVTCEGKSILPQSVKLADGKGNSPPMLTSADNDKVAALVPGVTLPIGAIGVVYGTATLIDGAITTVQYTDACAGASSLVQLPVKSERGHVLKGAAGTLPPGVNVPPNTVLRLQVFLDRDGVPLFPTYVSGPWELTDAAIDAAKQWRVEPPSMNGAPILTTSTLGITF